MLTKAACLSLFSLILSGTAIADQYSFCADGAEQASDTCSKIKVINKINVKVRSVNFIQQPTDGACGKDERNFSENLYEGEYGYVYIDPTCNYKVRFITSKGCSGDFHRVYHSRETRLWKEHGVAQGQMRDTENFIQLATNRVRNEMHAPSLLTVVRRETLSQN